MARPNRPSAAGPASRQPGGPVSPRGYHRIVRRGCLAGVALVMVAGAAVAHHSFAAEYRAEIKRWQGTITRFSWMNPHTWVFFDVADSHGNPVHMDCEGSAPSGLMRAGWTKETLRPGDMVTIEGNPAKDRPNGCKVRAVIFPDGRRLVMGLDAETDR